MNSDSHPQKDKPGTVPNSQEEIQTSIYPHHPEINVSEGAEFMNDALRMKDQPLQEKSNKKINRHFPDISLRDFL